MQHKAAWMGHLVRIELTREGLLVYLANHYTTQSAQANLVSVFFSFSYVKNCNVTNKIMV